MKKIHNQCACIPNIHTSGVCMSEVRMKANGLCDCLCHDLYGLEEFNNFMEPYEEYNDQGIKKINRKGIEKWQKLCSEINIKIELKQVTKQ